MKVLHLIPDFSVSSETFIYDLVCDLELMGIDNYVYTTCRVNESTRKFHKVYDSKTGYKDLFSKVVRNVRRRIFNRFNRFNAKKLINLVHNLNVDVVHSHFNYFFEDIIHLVDAGFDKRIVISCHGTDVLDKKLYLNKTYKSKVKECSRFDNVIFTTPSGFLKTELINNFSVPNSKILVVPNCYNSDIKTAFAKPIDLEKDIYLVNIGRLVNWKGQYNLINLVRELHDNGYTNVHLKIIGYGKLKSELQSLSNTLKIDNFVHFYDSLPHSEVFRELESSHIYIQSSIKDSKTFQEESFGIAVLEALSVNLPVIVSKSGGLPDTVLNINYPPYIQIVDIKHENELYQAVTNCLHSNFDCELMRHYAAKILAVYTKEKHRNTICQIYKV